jgi:hypothetical protein
MEESGPLVLFAGDLDDPWVAAIASALPEAAIRVNCPDELPVDWPVSGRRVETIVLHRAFLTAADAERIRRLKAINTETSAGAPRLILCFGPHVRYDDLQRWGTLVDVALPEATASEVLGRHVGGSTVRQSTARPPKVAVVSGLRDLRLVLTEAVIAAGYPAESARDWDDVAAIETAVWDVPVLEEHWPDTLSRETARRKVVTLMGFADRDNVTLARARGASACLDLPCDPADLAYVLDRISSRIMERLAENAHSVPPAPKILRPVRASGTVAERREET